MRSANRPQGGILAKVARSFIQPLRGSGLSHSEAQRRVIQNRQRVEMVRSWITGEPTVAEQRQQIAEAAQRQIDQKLSSFSGARFASSNSLSQNSLSTNAFAGPSITDPDQLNTLGGFSGGELRH